MRKILRISKVNNNGTKKRKRKAEALSRKELHSRLRCLQKEEFTERRNHFFLEDIQSKPHSNTTTTPQFILNRKCNSV